ncbi:type I polyketide synthase [Nocardia lijiangensis]|uniref:type I polyketide synthase n=1 Tax=Nocardia lijiangensis TaxID=299618 RepID=UPI003D72685E
MSIEDKLREHLKRSIADARDLRSRLRDVEDRQREAVAIVGVGCRFPGGVESAEGLWGLVADGVDVVSALPVDRGWDPDLFDADPDAVGKSYARAGGFLYDAADFDAGFFGISPREALGMDPQQRLLLESVWAGLEDAGIDPVSLRGSATGVFTGVMYHDYAPPAGRAPAEVEGAILTGTAGSVLSGRVAYTLGAVGPAVSVDTACSSSLVALHLAAQSLRSGECSLALAGGVTVMSTPETLIEFSRQRGLAPDGRCKSFSAAANGVGWSEGVGVLVLERLSDAQRLGHPVLAVVRGSAVNQDGASNGLTAPNGPSQQRVIRQALANAGVVAAEVDVVEAHGTGTTLGDPIEAQALLAAYGQDRPLDRPLWLGSIKSNIGHTQAAAGVAGVIKMVEAMRRGVLPKTLHADQPSPHVDWSTGAVELLTESRRWERSGRPRRAGVSSFGISGTNAHVIIEEAPAEVADDTVDAPAGGAGSTVRPEIPVVPWVVSAKSASALRAQAARLLGHVRDRDLDPVDVGWSLVSTRSLFAHRAVVVGRDRTELLAGLGAVAGGESGGDIGTGSAEAATSEVVFVFPGQGSQWAGMARGILADSPVFAEALARCDRELTPLLGWSVVDVVRGAEEKSLDRADVVQPVLFAVMVALAEVWRSLGVVPGAVVGHSQGEIAAVCVAGGLSLADAALIVARRSRLLAELAGTGGMLSIPLPRDAVEAALTRWGGRMSVAAVNGPRTTVVSGEIGAVDELCAALESEGVAVRRIPVDYASHSMQVEPVGAQLTNELRSVTPLSAQVPVWSTVTGGRLETTAMDAVYWYRNLREPVEFERAVHGLAAAGHTVFVEVSPHPVLTAGVQDIVEDRGGAAAVVGTLRRDRGGLDELLRQASGMFVHGVPVDWAAALPGGRRVALPTYAFERKRFWLRPVAGVADLAGAGLTAGGHPLLEAAVELADGGLVATGRLSSATHAWLADHAVSGVTVLPGTAFVELVVAAGDRVGCGWVDDLTLTAPLTVPERDEVRLQVVVAAPDDAGRRVAAVYSRLPRGAGAQTDWTLHATGMLGAGSGTTARQLHEWPPIGGAEVELTGAYERVAEHGYEYGPAFQGLRRVWRRDDEIFAEVVLAEAHSDEFVLHPALFDSALHALLPGVVEPQRQGGVPFSWSGVRIHAHGATRLRVRLSPVGPDAVSVALADDEGEPVATVESLVLREISAASLRAADRSPHDSLYELDWVPVTVPDGARSRRDQVFIGTDAAAWTDLAVMDSRRSFADLRALRDALGSGAPVPAAVVVAMPTRAGDVVEDVHGAVHDAIALIQTWLAEPLFADTRLVVLTQGGAVLDDDGVGDRTCIGAPTGGFAGAALWGLLRSAQTENPDRFVLIDLDNSPRSWEMLPAAVDSAEPQLVLRDGLARVPRLARTTTTALAAPDAPSWRLDAPDVGAIDALSLVPSDAATVPLAPGQVRVAVRAAGVNFRDVLMALGMYPGDLVLGSEGAGVVLEVGAAVHDLAPGDRVMGVFLRAFGPVAVADARMLAPMPAGWSFPRAATVPVVYLTAYYGLVDLAGLRAGETVLVHAGAGGVGMAAIQLARHLGAEVYATASPAKHGILRGLGVDEAHIGSSRSIEFEARFRTATAGRGVDVVLNSLAHEFVDASLRLTAAGGRFVEMGKTDIRQPEEIAGHHPTITYRAYDLLDAGPERMGQLLAEVLELFRQKEFQPLPARVWDIRRARDAFRFMREGRHVGKNVLGIDAVWDPDATVLITGASGALGAMLARHLVAEHGIRHLLLVSRGGSAALAGLRSELVELGAVSVTVAACDVADREALSVVLDAVPAERPLRVVVHAAGVLDDGVVTSLSAEQVDRVLAPKVAGAWNLHELTRNHDLTGFILYSSLSGLIGTAGQAGYAAGNAFLDALARHRSGLGLPGTSLAWGLWEQASGMTGHLRAADLDRMARGGIAALDAEQGLRLFDEAVAIGASVIVPARLDPAVLRANPGGVSRVLRGLVRVPVRRTAIGSAVHGSSWRERLAGLVAEQRLVLLGELIAGEVAAVLGHEKTAIGAGRAFKELGFDSLTAVELRNRLTKLLGVKLPAALLFDHPTVTELAEFLSGLFGSRVSPTVSVRASTVGTDGDAVAIVGVGCRFPGGVGSAEGLWGLVADGVDVVSGLPVDRGWDLGLFSSDPDAVGKSYAVSGGFLHDAAEFDAGFFGISPREALGMDPQQRLLLETVWEALEDAGIDPMSLRGSTTGVFTGVIAQDYGPGVGTVPPELAGLSLTGITTSVASGRIAYSLGLTGPALSVDTACSSSLVALHLAAQSLRSGECTLALAGGVTVMPTPRTFVEFSRQRVMSPDGRCKSFSAAADGAGWSEGVGVLVLERLSDAQRHGHPVLAIVRGSAVNQDGASNGLTAPNGPAQQRVIRQALANAGVAASEVDVVEAHGTGTRLGDPIEAEALLTTYGQDRPADRPLWLGSIKSNIGHTQAAAGVAGVIKMIEAMRRGVLPKTLHVEQPSPQVDWSAGAVELLTEPREWTTERLPRRAAVSSFGISGTNAHVILEEPPTESMATATAAAPRSTTAVMPWVVSGKSGAALRAQAARLLAHVRDRDVDPVDVGWSLASTRSMFAYRAVVVGRDHAELLDGLRAVASGETDGHGPMPRPDSGVVWVFPGQGSQWAGMGRVLLADSAVFRERLADCDAALSPWIGWSVRDVLMGAEGAPELDRVDVVQPVLFAVMVSLAAVWRRWGVTPSAVVGHSQGEIAAACVAGVLSLREAAHVVAVRSSALRELAGDGGMLSVALPESDVHVRLGTWRGADQVSIAAVNGPGTVVLSGPAQALDSIERMLTEQEIRCRRIPVNYASHSAHVDQIEQALVEQLAVIEPQQGEVAFYSTVTGGQIDTAALDASYWFANLRSTVRFHDAIAALARAGHRTFLEVSPHPVLVSGIAETLDTAAEPGVVVGSLRRAENDSERLLGTATELCTTGIDIDWASALSDIGLAGRRVPLPTYAFQRQRFWFAAGAEPGSTASDGVDEHFWRLVEQGDTQELANTLTTGSGGVAAEAWLPVLPALRSWRKAQQARATVDGWRYRVEWKSGTDSDVAVAAGTWLLVAPHECDRAATTEQCAAALRARGADVVVVTAPDDASVGDRAQWRARLLDTVAKSMGGTDVVAGVVSLLSTVSRPLSASPALSVGVAGTLGLVQGMGDAGLERPLWCVTSGAVSVGAPDVLADPAQAAVWGLGRVVALEHPARWGGLIDLPATIDGRTWDRVCAVVAGAEEEDQVAVRPSGVYLRRLVPVPATTAQSSAWTPTGTILITLDADGLGAHTARWLAGFGTARLVVVTGDRDAAAVAELAAELEAGGTPVRTVTDDLTDRPALTRILDGISAEHPLTAVFHTAATTFDRSVDELEAASFAEAVAEQVIGARVLDELLAERGREVALVSFSSGAGVWGAGGRAADAAGSAYLDALSEYRRGAGMPAMTIAWGMVADGDPIDADTSSQFDRLGLISMPAELATAALHQAITAEETTSVVADVDWSRFYPALAIARPRPLLHGLPAVAQLLAAEGTSQQLVSDAGFAARLVDLPDDEQRATIVRLIGAHTAAVLGHTITDELDAEQAFRDLGFDSLTAVELRTRLNKATGLRLPATAVFDHPTPALLARHIREALLGNGSTVMTMVDDLEAAMASTAADRSLLDEVRRRLAKLANPVSDVHPAADHDGGGLSELMSMDDHDVFDVLRDEFGIS